jgi:tetratricopeptide (TPR) repeat protein
VKTQKIIYLVVGLVLGFAVGFFFTNNIDRKAIDSLNGEVARLKASAPKEKSATNSATNSATGSPDNSKGQLTEEELRKAIAKGDSAPKDAALQRKLGHGLYLYAINFHNPAILPDAVRMLKRAHDADPKDFETTTLLGNALFDWGQASDPAHIAEARTYFQKALEIKPDNAEARTSLGLTYYFDKPADPARAIKEYRKSLVVNPRHEMTLQSLAAALITTGELVEAQKRIDELQGVNPSNAALTDLRGQLAQKTNAMQNGQRATGDAKD